jgi:hypothetical protein
VWLVLRSTIWQTLAYPPAINLTCDQCESIMSPILHYCLPALGICRNFPRKLVHAPLSRMGLHLVHLHTLQEIYQRKDIVTHTFQGTLTGQLYKLSLELFFIELGQNPNLHHFDLGHVQLLTMNSLIKSSIIFTFMHNIRLQHNITTTLPRQNDCFIMESIARLQLTYEELLSFNHCQIYLRALFLSVLATGDGTMISQEAWTGNYVGEFRFNSWPHYGRPSPARWVIWRSILTRVFISRGRRLRLPLGAWKREDPDWQWYISENGLYRRIKESWFYHRPLIRRR